MQTPERHIMRLLDCWGALASNPCYAIDLRWMSVCDMCNDNDTLASSFVFNVAKDTMATLQGRNPASQSFLPASAPALGLDGSTVHAQSVCAHGAVLADHRQRPRDERRSWQVARSHAGIVGAKRLKEQSRTVQV